MHRYIREPVNGFTHLAGALLAFIGLLFMVVKGAQNLNSNFEILSVIIFGVSMILLYSASATYHMVVASDQVIALLRRLDHSMIYILIAGTYTPYCVITLEDPIGWIMLLVIWIIAILGVVFKLILLPCPRWHSRVLYICMVWLIL